LSKVKKIEDRTRWFIDEYNRLADAKRLPSNVELARIMGINSKSAVTNILKGDQNIQPQHWEKFKVHFKVENPSVGSNKSEREPKPMELLAGLMEGFKAIADTMKSIESKMAQEKTQAKIDQTTGRIESNLDYTKDLIELLSQHVDSKFEDLAETLSKLAARKNASSQGANKKQNGSDGAGQKSGKLPS
jgi:hypothetical protein